LKSAKSAKRFVAALLAGMLMAFGLSHGLTPGLLPGWANESVPATTSEPSPGPGTLEVEPASLPDNTLPTPYPEQPDGTLRLPNKDSTEGAAVASPETTTNSEQPVTYSRIELLAGLDPTIAKRSELLMEADDLYLAGDTAAAEAVYKRAKESKWLAEEDLDIRVLPITDPAELPPAGAVYWREAQAGAESGVASRVGAPGTAG
jgi:hypothetical protein